MDMVTCRHGPHLSACTLPPAVLDLEQGGIRDHTCARKRPELSISANQRQQTILSANLAIARPPLMHQHQNQSCQLAFPRNQKITSSTLLTLRKEFASGKAMPILPRHRKHVWQLDQHFQISSPNNRSSIPPPRSRNPIPRSRSSPANIDPPSIPLHTQQRKSQLHTHQHLSSPPTQPQQVASSHKPGSSKWPTRSRVRHRI